MTTDTATALAALRRWADDLYPGEISTAIVEWTADAFAHEPDASVVDVIRHLEMTDCAACHAPSGLIYTRDIARKLEAWQSEIDEAIAAYHDATGENPRPRDGALTLGWLVWFAVEWTAQEAAYWLRSEMEG
jgi:hypothetical protein